MYTQFGDALPSPFLKDIVQWRATKQPTETVYVFLANGETIAAHLTYAELDANARAVAACLQDRWAPGERALLIYPAGLAFIVAFFGCLYTGVIPIPACPPRRHKLSDKNLQRLAAIIQDAEPALVLAPSETIAQLSSFLPDLPDLQKPTWLAHEAMTTDLTATYHNVPGQCSDLAFLQYTSGTTAQPKGVMITHGALHEQLAYYRQRAGTAWQQGSMVGWLPHYHDYGLIGFILSAVYLGVPYHFMAPEAFVQRPINWLKAISCFRATYTGGPNFAYDLCSKMIEPAACQGVDLRSLQIVSVSAEPIFAQTLQRFIAAFQPFGLNPHAFLPSYGLAEAVLCVSSQQGVVAKSFCVTALQCNRVKRAPSNGRVLVSCGQPLQGQEILIVDPETKRQTAGEEVGEIWVGGKSLAKGYWQRPLASEQTFASRLGDSAQGPYLRTGDLGFQHEGHLFITGRLKDMIIVRGQNYAPQDIEATVQAVSPALRYQGGAVFLVHEANEEHLIVVQELDRHYRDDRRALCFSVRAAIAEGHGLSLAAIELIVPFSLPKTTSGKIQRHQCRTAFQNRTLKTVVKYVFDEDTLTLTGQDNHELLTVEKLEKQIIAIVCQALSIKQITAHDNLFSFGINSLVAFNLIFQIQDRYKVELPFHLLFDMPTIAQIANHIQQQRALFHKVS